MGSRLALPVDDVLGELASLLATHDSVLICAPPGSGKTTRVPPAVQKMVGQQKVLLLQPRRIAARYSAHRIAHEEGCAIGSRVGYRIRFENRTSSETKIEVITEGLLTRKLQSDPFLDGVGAVILDEFHERSIHSDLALALLREVQQDARPDLKIIVMSATLDVSPIQQFFGGESKCPVLRAEGKMYDVKISYDERTDDRPIEVCVAAAVHRMLATESDGHVLAFMPGVAEIERCMERLNGSLPDGVQVLPLHGRLKGEKQDRVLQSSVGRKVILSTNIAETSLTIDGVTGVIDTGLVRRPRFDPRLGVERLETVFHSQASAVQRSGRAGRTRAGHCHRLWTPQAHALREAHAAPEICMADLTSTILQLYAWGARPERFQWFEAPPSGVIATAEALLVQLGALEGTPVQLTNLGRQLAQLPIHPRLGRMIIEGKMLGVLNEAAAAVALASERDTWSRSEGISGDLLQRLRWIDSQGRTGADPRALSMVRRVRDQLVQVGRKLSIDEQRGDASVETCVVDALITGFPDRVGLRRASSGRGLLLSSGSGADLAPGVVCGDCFVAVVLTAGRKGSVPWVRVTADVDPERLAQDWVDESVFDLEREAVVYRRVRRFGALVLEEKPSHHSAPPADVSAALLGAAITRFKSVISVDKDVDWLLGRVGFLLSVRPELESPEWMSDLSVLLPQWCEGRRSFAQLRKIDIASDLKARLPWSFRALLDEIAPERMNVPSGTSVRLEYPLGQAPVLSARIQQLFGMMSTPRLGGVPLTVHLLAPNGRPAQVTQDLQSFWAHTYMDVRKDLRGRYPKHAWPEDPSKAIPENRPRRRR